MARGLASRGLCLTIVTLPESMKHPSMIAIAHSAEIRQQDAPQLIPAHSPLALHNTKRGIGGLVARESAYWRMFRTWYRVYAHRFRPDVVFLPYLDYCLYAIGLLGSPFGDCAWVGLAMRPSFHYRRVGVIAPRPALASVKEALFFRLLRNTHLRCLLTIDEALSEYLAGWPALKRKTAFFPEPVELRDLPDPVDAKQRFGVPSDRRLILVYGAITSRKGVLELLQALADPVFPSSVDVLLAGEISPEVHEALASSVTAPLVAQGRVRPMDRFIESEEEPTLFAAADMVWLGYRGHYTPSGVLAQAASAGRPVLACEEGVIGWQAKRHNLGEVFDPANPVALIAAVRALLRHNGARAAEGVAGPSPVGGKMSHALDVLDRALAGYVGYERGVSSR